MHRAYIVHFTVISMSAILKSIMAIVLKILKKKNYYCGRGSVPDPSGELTALPQTLWLVGRG